MSETSDKSASVELNSKKDALSYYASLLGLDQRRYPKKEELPEFIYIPPEVLGDFENSILANTTIKREHSQSVFWNSQKGVRKSKVFVGEERRTSSGDAIHKLTISHFGEKALFYYHTHPSGNWFFSPRDIGIAYGLPRLSFITGVGSDTGATFIFQADGYKKLHISSTYSNLNFGSKLREDDIKRTQKDLSDRNLILYYWVPPTDTLRAGDMKNGIEVMKLRL